jgi:PPM family protein phosphatase
MKTHQFISREMKSPVHVDLPQASAMVFSCVSPVKPSGNEDCASIISVNEDISLLIVADGLGGPPNGAVASALLCQVIEDSISNLGSKPENIREAILSSIENTNLELLKKQTGEGTTLTICEIHNNKMRSYHIGDSEIQITDSLGFVKFQTLSHSPVAYAVESGFIDEDRALSHEDRHFISNYVGDPNMFISMNSALLINNDDTILLGSDGLFDNLYKHEIAEILKEKNIEKLASSLMEIATLRMGHWQKSKPSKPDDLTFIVYRPK